MKSSGVRIIAGEARGRRIEAPAGRETRPTADRVRESIFNVLGQRLDGEHVLDLYAGSGAMGFEALSRGAAHATFVDLAQAATEACARNARALGWEERVEVIRGDALRVLRRLEAAGRSFDLVFVDPPYPVGPAAALEHLGTSRLLRPGGWVVVEHETRWRCEDRYGILCSEDQRRFGATTVTWFGAEREEPP